MGCTGMFDIVLTLFGALYVISPESSWYSRKRQNPIFRPKLDDPPPAEWTAESKRIGYGFIVVGVVMMIIGTFSP